VLAVQGAPERRPERRLRWSAQAACGLPGHDRVCRPVEGTGGEAAGAAMHAVALALTAAAATVDLVPGVCAAGVEVPIVAVVLEQAEAVRLLPGSGANSPAVPAYAYPESAARAPGHAVRYGTWRAAPPEPAPGLDGVRQDLAETWPTGFPAGR
jgi:hypothetical protein